jgi:hypothetical protein
MKKVKEVINEFVRQGVNKKTKISLFLLFVFGLLKSDWRNYKIAPVKWMDYEKISKKGLLETKNNSISVGPKYIGSNKNIISKLEVPELYYRVFDDGQISANSSSVFLNDEILIEKVGNGEQKRFNYSGGQIKMHGDTYALVNCKNPKKIECGIFLGGNGAFNYYHWLIEIVPKFEYLNDLPSNLKRYPLLIPDYARDISSFAEILKIVSKGWQVIYLKPNDLYVVNKLVYIDTPNNLPFNLFGNNRFKVNDFLFRTDSLEYLRRTFLREISSEVESCSSYPDKIFLARKKSDNKRQYNQDEIKAQLEGFGFKSVCLETLSFKQQVEIMNHAEWVVGPTGAAWTNIVFAREGTKCLCWMAEQYGEFSAFSNIAANVGVDIKYLTINTPVHHTRYLYLQNYLIDTLAIERALLSMGLFAKGQALDINQKSISMSE